MCGHVGIAGKLEHKDESYMKKLLVLDYFRGTDSTGFAQIEKNGHHKIAKIASHPFDLFDCNSFDKALNAFQSVGFIGHNRAATKGKVSSVNAHPFECDHIIGAHNGTLSNHSFELLNKQLGKEYGTDSEAIFASIAKFGVEETISQLQGAWALVWYDGNEDAMFFLRNKERPLWYAYSPDFKKMFWSSEWEFLRAANEISSDTLKNKFYQDVDKGYRFWSFAEDTLYKVPMDKLMEGSDKFPSYYDRMVKGREAPAGVTGRTYPFTGRDVTHLGTGTTTSQTYSTATTFTATKPKVMHFEATKENPFAGFLTEEKFTEIAKYGCSYCGADVNFDDEGITVYESIGSVLCQDCSPNAVTRMVIVESSLEEVL